MHPKRLLKYSTTVLSAGLLAACGPAENPTEELARAENCPVELIVLGVGQDAGAPQIGNPSDPAWNDPAKKLFATSLGLIDHENQKRYLFEATPDIREQMQILDKLAPPNPDGPYLDGIFLTHAHIGHYAGLMFLGRESAGTSGVPVYVMPRLKEYLETNGPWDQLVKLQNVKLKSAVPAPSYGLPIVLPGEVGVIPFEVPHRDEYSETVGFVIKGKTKAAMFLPDIDGWDEWTSLSSEDWIIHTDDIVIRDMVGKVDYAFLDATFFDDHELPGRDMSQIPHPRVTETMDLFDIADGELKSRIRFIHINHTNPLRDRSSEAFNKMSRRGYKMSKRGERFCL